jgi:predicted transcriptional regulator of viral defense system
MTNNSLIVDNFRSLLTKNGGIISMRQGQEAGFSQAEIMRAVEECQLDRISRGVYISPDQLNDEMYLAQLRRPKIVFSHNSALVLHGLTDRHPFSHSVTVPTGYNTKPLLDSGFTVFSLKHAWYEQDIVQLETPFGHMVNAYSLERTIVDSFRSRNRMDPEIVQEALKQFIRRRDIDLLRLSNLSKKFGVHKIILPCLQVLL